MTRSQTIDDLIQRYLDDGLSDQELDVLSHWIQESPSHAQQFAESLLLHDRLQTEMGAMFVTSSESGDAASPSAHVVTANHERNRQNTGRKLGVFFWIASAACLLAVIGTAGWRAWDDPAAKPRSANQEFFATISQVVDVDWELRPSTAGSKPFAIGQRVGAGSLRLRSGIVRLLFDDGVEVTLQGPAEYELRGPARTRLTSGLLSAVVPPGAEGFRVDTPAVEVTDLGTAFGIRLEAGGISEVLVFEGEVDVAPHNGSETRLLKAGEAVRVGEGKDILPVDIDVSPFEKVWPVSSGILGSSGAFRFAPPWPRRLRFARSDDHVFVRRDGPRLRLPEMLDVNVTEPGRYSREDQLTPGTVPAGTDVRTFTLHYHPENAGPDARIEGSITFDRPILGVIVLESEFAASKRVLSPQRASEFREQRQLELRGEGSNGDMLVLSEDRHTLRLSLAVARRFSDSLRVVVDARSPTEISRTDE